MHELYFKIFDSYERGKEVSRNSKIKYINLLLDIFGSLDFFHVNPLLIFCNSSLSDQSNILFSKFIAAKTTMTMTLTFPPLQGTGSFSSFRPQLKCSIIQRGLPQILVLKQEPHTNISSLSSFSLRGFTDTFIYMFIYLFSCLHPISSSRPGSQ